MALKYKEGDRVRIKSLDWYNRQKNETEVKWKYYSFSCHMTKYCGQIMTISIVGGYSYSMIEDDGVYSWTDEMIEGLAEEETYNFLKTDKPYPSSEDRLDNIQFVVYNELKLPDGYIFKDENGNIINATKIVLEKKKKEYPKTYEECCEIIHSDPKFYVDTHLYSSTLEALYKLLICRDAYWKIAGDEMGLGKPWEPDYNNEKQLQYGLYEIVKYSLISPSQFAFPTSEMRDAFYDNFKELIETIKN